MSLLWQWLQRLQLSNVRRVLPGSQSSSGIMADGSAMCSTGRRNAALSIRMGESRSGGRGEAGCGHCVCPELLSNHSMSSS